MKNNVLIITGGNRGIGLATLKYFLKQGDAVINLSRTALNPKLKLGSRQVWDLRADLTDPDGLVIKLTQQIQADKRLRQLLEKASRICLIHNAAALMKDSVPALPTDQLLKVLKTNVVAPVALNQLFLPYMKGTKGSSILYVGSTLAHKAVAGAASYVISKHALKGLMRATVQDLFGQKIHTACLCPGLTDTEMLNEHLKHDKKMKKWLAAQTAFGRLLDPMEQAQGLWFLAQNPSANGAMLDLNLGQKEY